MPSIKKILTGLILAVLVGLLIYFDIHEQIDLAWLKAQQQQLELYYQQNTLLTILVYAVVYIGLSSTPVAAVLTLAGGALFGLLFGTIIVSIVSTLGATLAFLLSRYLFHDAVQNRFSKHLHTINNGIEKDGSFYLFALRLVPAFPFFAVNLIMGLSRMKTLTYMWVSQIGMLPGTIVYVFAGTQLAEVNTVKDIFTPDIIGAFALLGLFPLLMRKLLGYFSSRKQYSRFIKPKKFDHNLVVIGAGSAGLVSAYIAAAVKAKVTLIEKHKMGGDCLNTGCVPSKALLRSAKFRKQLQRGEEFGFEQIDTTPDISRIMQRVHRVIEKIEPHDSVERYTKLGVECISGEAEILSPYEVKVNNTVLSTRNIIIASGAHPFVPPIPGIDTIDYLTSDSIWNLATLPENLLILGGGPIGCELAQAFARLGSRVTQVEMLPTLISKEDPEFSEMMRERLQADGVNVLLQHKALRFQNTNNKKTITCENLTTGSEVEIEFDQVLVAVGRRANTAGLGLENLGIELNPDRTLKVNEYLQTNFPNIYACGDAIGPYQFTHTAAHEAWYCAVNALFGRFKKFRVDYSVVPWATFTEPEIARVGINETEAEQLSIPYDVTTYGIDDLDRAIADSEAHGLVKVLTVPGKDKILGVTIAGDHAADLIAEFVLAMKHNIGLNKILGTIHIYPTMAEANKYVAGNWKRANAPEGLLKWVQRYHQWGRR